MLKEIQACYYGGGSLLGAATWYLVSKTLGVSDGIAAPAAVLGGLGGAVVGAFALELADEDELVTIQDNARAWMVVWWWPAFLLFDLGCALRDTVYETIRRIRSRHAITEAPGAPLLRLADCVCRKATGDLIVQMVADMRVEYFASLKAGKPLKARWIELLYYMAIARAVTLDRVLGAAFSLAMGVMRPGK